MNEVLTRAAPGRAVRSLRWREWVDGLGPPVLAFAAATLVLWVTATAQGSDFVSNLTWSHWDSLEYASVAINGYNVHPCRLVARYWCGNSGWFPGYPALLSLFHTLGVPVFTAGVVIAWLFALATLIVL